jgi:hypothetical protein
MNMQHLFPVPIGMFDLGRPLSKKEYSFILGQDTRHNQGNATSANHFVLCDQVMTPLRGWVEDCVAEYFKATTNPKHDVNLRVTQSWFNYSKQGQSLACSTLKQTQTTGYISIAQAGNI